MSATRATVVRFPLERRQPRRLVAMRELQEHSGMSERWLRYRLAEGMPAHRYGKRLRFDLAEVDVWLEGRYAS